MNWLKKKVNSSVERLGFILKNGSEVEVKNISENPAEGGLMRTEDLMEYYPISKATWHTHVGTANLSGSDYIAFMGYPDLDHYIAGDDGIIKYSVKGDDLVQEII